MKLTKEQIKDIAIRMVLTVIEIGIPAFFSTLYIAKQTNADTKVALAQAGSVAGSMVITACIHVGKNLIKAFINDGKVTKEELESAFDVDVEGGEGNE